MKWTEHILTFGVLAAILFLGSCPVSFSSQLVERRSAPATFLAQTNTTQKRLDGIWVGVVVVSGMNVRLILRIAQDSAGALKARLDVPDQGASDLPIETITAEGQL